MEKESEKKISEIEGKSIKLFHMTGDFVTLASVFEFRNFRLY